MKSTLKERLRGYYISIFIRNKGFFNDPNWLSIDLAVSRHGSKQTGTPGKKLLIEADGSMPNNL